MKQVICAVVSAAAWLGAAQPASAADPPTAHYAVMSLVGDRLTIVRGRDQTGSHMSRNEEQVIPVPEATLDNVAVLAVDAALRRVDALEAPTLLASRDPQIFALGDAMAQDPDASGPLLDALRGQLRQTKATRLILITKYRGEARMPMANGYVGSGMLVGLGVYIDTRPWVRVRSTGVRDQGYIAPYAYVTLNLVDVDSMRVIKRTVMSQARVVPAAVSASAVTPWETMTSEQKIEGVERLIRRAVAQGLPQLLEGS